MQNPFSVVRCADTGSFNFLNPPKRDVVSIGSAEGDFVSIRFRTDNPGPWILRWYVKISSSLVCICLTCSPSHIDFHLDM